MPRILRANRAALIGLGTVLVACRSESPRAEPELLPSLRAPTWTATDSFSTIADVRRLGDGRTLVLDFGTKTVRMLDVTGTSMASVGGEGSGPGEFRAPVTLLAMPVDSTLVIDRTLRRLTLVWPPGSLDRSIPIPEAAGYPFTSAKGVLPDGRVAYQATLIAPAGANATSAVMATRLADAQPESLFAIRIPETVKWQSKSNASSSATQVVPYALEDDWAVASDGAIAIVRADPFHIEWRLPSGEVVNGPVQDFDAVAVTDSERTEWPGLSLPANKPPFVAGTSFVDPVGRVWVQRTVGNNKMRRWSVFNRRGLDVGHVDITRSRRIIHLAAAGVYVIKTDSDNVPWLEFYEWHFSRQ